MPLLLFCPFYFYNFETNNYIFYCFVKKKYFVEDMSHMSWHPDCEHFRKKCVLYCHLPLDSWITSDSTEAEIADIFKNVRFT